MKCIYAPIFRPRERALSIPLFGRSTLHSSTNTACSICAAPRLPSLAFLRVIREFPAIEIVDRAEVSIIGSDREALAQGSGAS